MELELLSALLPLSLPRMGLEGQRVEEEHVRLRLLLLLPPKRKGREGEGRT